VRRVACVGRVIAVGSFVALDATPACGHDRWVEKERVVNPERSSEAAVARVVALQGGSNFRDLGGYPTAGGGRVRWGRVYRSGGLHRLTADDLMTLERLGLRVVYDLRLDEERSVAPSIVPDGVRCEPLPIGGTAARTKEITDLFVEGKLAEIPPDFLLRIYDVMAEVAATTFGQLLTKLADPNGTPALFHCTQGKDRTGLTAALLLSVLGVDEAAVLDDYELSAAHFTEREMRRLQPRLDAAGIDLDHYRAVFGAPRHAMAGLLATLRERHGSVEGYLRAEAGVADEVITELRARLVDPPDAA